MFQGLLVSTFFLATIHAFAPLQSRESSSVLRLQPSTDDAILECATLDEQDGLKRRLFQLAASYDRGFSATESARRDAASVIQDLERSNPEVDAARGVDGTNSSSPLEGAWRMIWTTAADVLVLGASPVAAPGAIYQVFEPPIVTNIIDFLPRVQSLLPPNVMPNSVLRANVQTRAAPRTEENPNRVGLVFENVKLQPMQLLGQTVDGLPPLGFDLPKLPGTTDPSSGPGYFDVTYLDDELLVIRQNEPGGLFALLKVDSTEV